MGSGLSAACCRGGGGKVGRDIRRGEGGSPSAERAGWPDERELGPPAFLREESGSKPAGSKEG